MKIGILQTAYVAEPLIDKHGQYPDMFAKLLAGHGFEFETFAVLDNKFPQSVDRCDGWIITGSPFGVYEDHAFISPLEDFIRAAYDKEIPMAGICFGHQIMAQALGGKVEKFAGGWGLGKMTYQSGEGSRSVIAVHQDQVVEKPADATAFASSEFCKYAGLAYKKNAISWQPHPEFSEDYTRDLIAYRTGTVFDQGLAENAYSSFDGELDNELIGKQLAAFFLAGKTEKAA